MILKRYKIALLLTCFSFSILVQAQKITYPHTAFWTKTEATEIFPNKFGVGTDFIVRSNSGLNDFNIFTKWHRVSIRPWFHYQFSENLRVSVSPVSYFATSEYHGKPEDLNSRTYNEMRTTFQVLHHHKMMGEKFTHTFRHWYEIRYRNPFEDNNFTFTRYRIRYRLRYLINKDYYSENQLVYTYISNEIMTNFGNNIVYNMFSQNRIQLAVGYRFLNSMRFELRYMNRYRSRPTGFEYDNTHALMAGLFIDQISRIGRRDIRPVRFFD
ncbi:MAG: DUF2490 domain-containing protein [Cyclobacteriaceae bacterium]|nr:DUF2490 domain-containing protein [Cyclobacteriaceae bacterium]